MDKNQIESFHQRLLQEQDRLEQEVRQTDASRVGGARPQGELSDVPTHAADRDAEELGADLTISETLREKLRAIDAALGRIRDGTYGTCQRCGQAISVERLEVLPHAPYCVECEREAERE